MPLSFQQHTANGVTTVFAASQIDGYLSVNDIYVYVDNVLKTAGTHYNLQTSPSLQVTFTAGNTPANGAEVRIQRITPSTVAGRAVDFADGSVLNADDLDKSALQLLYITQEAEDTGSGALGKQFDQLSWNAESLSITNASTGGGTTDLTTKGYVDNLALYGGGAVNPQTWTFSGDGVVDTFTLSPVANATNPAMFIVEVGGTILRPTTDYTIPTDSQIVFAAPPALGTDNITVRNFGVSRNLNESVSTAMIQNSAVTAAKIDSNAVTTAKINAGAVTSAKLDASLAITTGLTVGGQAVGPNGTSQNTVLGTSAGSVSTGSANTAIGHAALEDTTTGFQNTAVGANALGSNDTGSGNAAVGNFALADHTASIQNSAVGNSALRALTSGNQNTAIGLDAGRYQGTGTTTVTTASNSVFVGFQSRAAGNSQSNQIVIGHNAVGHGSDTTTIGNLSTTRTVIPAGTLEVAGGMAQSLINKQFSDSPVSGASVSAAFPTWVRRVTISFAAVSSSGTSYWALRVIRGGTPETANYKSRVLHHGVAWDNTTAAFLLTRAITAANFYTGTYVLDRVDTAGTIWCLSGQMMDDGANTLFSANGHYAGGSTPITGIEVLPSVPPQVWDGGRIAISWE